MPSPATTLSSNFSGHLRYLEYTRNKMERLLTDGVIVTRDINQVYIGLYLEAITSLETLIEALFLGLLSGRFTVESQAVEPLVSFKNRTAVRPILFRDRNYLDWLPYGSTEERAQQFFRDGVPFSCLGDRERQLIRTAIYLRNAIAHKSRHSLEMFEERVLGNQNLMPHERRPAGYLRSVFRTSPNQNRYENFIQGMAYIATTLCS